MQTSIPLPDTPTITESDGNRAVFVIERCAPGYGLTLGNAFRRVLLSSLSGAAITTVRIEGVDHEFSTIEYVKEDVIQILLNLKQVPLSCESDEPVRGTVSVTGNKTTEKVVTAGDLEFPSDVEVADPDAYIATITDKKGKIDMEVEVEAGLGYVRSEDHKKDKKLPVGTLAIDAVFSPIRKVSYDVENMRVGERTDFNRLTISIETDGSVDPQEAFEQAAGILVNHFKVFMSPKDIEELEAMEAAMEAEEEELKKEMAGAAAEEADAEEEEEEEEDPRKTAIEDLGLPTRVETLVSEAGIRTVGGIAKHTEQELLDIEGMGAVSVKEIKRAIGKLGVTLRK